MEEQIILIGYGRAGSIRPNPEGWINKNRKAENKKPEGQTRMPNFTTRPNICYPLYQREIKLKATKYMLRIKFKTFIEVVGYALNNIQKFDSPNQFKMNCRNEMIVLVKLLA